MIDTLSPRAQGIVGLYEGLAPYAGGAVRLSTIRRYLGSYDRTEIDAALEELADTDGVYLRAEEDQAGLTGQDRAAALRLGGQDRHNLAIDWADIEED
ncbi:MAG TPA: hypothetical protein VGN22_15960 [Pseudonocardia sp.]